MTLEKIDQRIDLFKEYLHYQIDNWFLFFPWWQFNQFKITGMWFHYEEPLCFDAWLIKNGHRDLIE